MLKITDIARNGLSRIILMGGVILLSGCGQIAAPNAQVSPPAPVAETVEITEIQTIPVARTQEAETQMNPSLPIPAVPDPQMLIEKAKEDLAQRLSISASQINLMETKKVFWADASLGCPQPGVTYIQAQTPGYLIMLESDGNEFEYHANIHNYVFYCENPTPPILETPMNVYP